VGLDPRRYTWRQLTDMCDGRLASLRRIALDQADLVWRISFGDGLTAEECKDFILYGWLPEGSGGDCVIPYDPNVLMELNKHMAAG
jgi:hypothetical protein